ncbi:hypothetical protein V8C42DRAFT_309210 [Trichoderma barbatum]
MGGGGSALRRWVCGYFVCPACLPVCPSAVRLNQAMASNSLEHGLVPIWETREKLVGLKNLVTQHWPAPKIENSEHSHSRGLSGRVYLNQFVTVESLPSISVAPRIRTCRCKLASEIALRNTHRITMFIFNCEGSSKTRCCVSRSVTHAKLACQSRGARNQTHGMQCDRSSNLSRLKLSSSWVSVSSWGDAGVSRDEVPIYLGLARILCDTRFQVGARISLQERRSRK